MKVSLKSLGMNVSLFIEKQFKESDHVTASWHENVSKAFETNAKAT